MKHFSRSLSLTFGNQSSQMSLHKPETCSDHSQPLATTCFCLFDYLCRRVTCNTQNILLLFWHKEKQKCKQGIFRQETNSGSDSPLFASQIPFVFSYSDCFHFGYQSCQMSLHKPASCSEIQVFFGGKELLHALISEQASLVVTSS